MQAAGFELPARAKASLEAEARWPTAAGELLRARGFSVYDLANAVFNIVTQSSDYLRGIEEVLGNIRTLSLMHPFYGCTNLHEFIREISTDILTEEVS